MKKLFFAVCFNLFFVESVSAGVHPINDYEHIPQRQEQTSSPKIYEIEMDRFKEMVQEGFDHAQKTDPKDINKTVSIAPTALSRKMQEEENKSMFQKIYERALDRVEKQNTPPLRNDVVSSSSPIVEIRQQQQIWNAQLPVVMAYLPPDNKPTKVPALEHIPYLMNSIEILPNGLVKFKETVVVVANGEKLSKGLSKILPTKIYNEMGKSKRLDYSVVEVKVNDAPVDYHFEESRDKIFLIPQDDYELSPGIYTYTFEYLVDNLLWEYDDFYGFYWDVGGNGWNLVVDRLGASLSLPQEGAILERRVFLGQSEYFDENAVNVKPNGRFATAFIASRPLFIGEGMHLVARINKAALLPTTLWQKVERIFYDYGDIYIAFLGMIIVVLSFIISWRYIAKDKGQLKISLSKNALIIRYLLLDRFDIKSVCGFLLELYKKNIIDIQQSEDTILLIKRTDNMKSIDIQEQKALRRLFPNHETVFNVNKQNILPLKRFAADLEQSLRRQMINFRLKLNIGYLLLSLAMLFVTEVFIAILKTNSMYAFFVMLITTCIALAASGLWYCARRRWLKVLTRLLSIDVFGCCLIVMSAVINPLAALLLLMIPLIIVFALAVYSKRMGLIKHYIQDMALFKEYLKDHHDNIVLGKDFLNYQAAIWALDMEDEFVPTGNPEYYKLPIIKNISACFSK